MSIELVFPLNYDNFSEPIDRYLFLGVFLTINSHNFDQFHKQICTVNKKSVKKTDNVLAENYQDIFC